MADKYPSIRRMLGVAGLVVAVSGGAVLAQAVAATAATAATAVPSAPANPTASPSATTPASTSGLTPIVDCIVDAPLGTAVTSRTVLLGYRSTAAERVSVPAGSGSNDLAPGGSTPGQPTSFAPGEHHAVWSLTLDAQTAPTASWRLGTATAAIDATAPSCATVSTVAVSAPRVVASGGIVTLTAAVGRMLLAAPADGRVEFAFEGSAPTSVAVDAAGVARADLPAPAAGEHTITARYVPATGSALRPSSASADLAVTSRSAALGVTGTSIAADGGHATVTVGRASGAGGATVDYATADGSAVAGVEYRASRGTVEFRDGQTTSTIEVPLLPRAAGAPASTFFVLLQRATTTVDAASASITLPAIPVAPAGAVVTGSSPTSGAGGDSLLPSVDPTSPVPAAHAQDLAMLIGAALLTVGGILGVVGLVRFGGSRDARA